MAKETKIPTVADLVEKLLTYDQTLPIGNVGHFGEFNPIDLRDVGTRNAHVDFSGKSRYWRQITDHPSVEVVQITMPEIGPEPD